MTKPSSPKLTRRSLIAAAGAASVTLGQRASARVPAGKDTDYAYEVQKTDDEWLAQLGEYDFDILRNGYTESQKSSPLWEENRPGTYHCKGCELRVFDGRWKVMVEGKGWVFFLHPQPDSVLTNIDGPTPEYGSMAPGKDPLTEIHCRRCGSHLGHFLIVEGKQTHCINGAAMTFTSADA